ncbi:MAG TPA: hypothetical protein DCL63_01555, partial [Firmicutes bacterium]|nr:hypothetical protein [Bacillota bacterium]
MKREIRNERNEGLLRRVAETPLGARLLLGLVLILLPIITVALGRSYVVYLYSLVMVYVIVTLGLNILTGYTGQISIGHAGFMAVAAYTSAILTGRFGVPFLLALVIASLFAAVLGL